jgi:hypothetical protein
MKIVRRIGILVATAAVSVGIVGAAAPAHALDISWGYSVHR